MIPEKAAAAAANALIREQSGGCYAYRPEGHPKRDDMDRYAEAHARAALEAAAPYMLMRGGESYQTQYKKSGLGEWQEGTPK